MLLQDLKLSLFLTGKYIRRGNYGTLFMTMLIMALCFINLVFMPSLFNGLILASNDQAIDHHYANIIIEPENSENYIKNVKEIESKIDGIPGINGYSAHYSSGAVISYDKKNDGRDIESGVWKIKSINVPDEKKTVVVHEKLLAGEYLEDGDRAKIILGKEVSGGYDGVLEKDSLHGVQVGENVKLTFNNGISREYEVKGIFGTKSPIVDNLIFITEEEMESVLGLTNQASEIIVSIENVGTEEKYIEEFRNVGIIDEEIKTWEEYMGVMDMMNESFSMVQNILTGIGLVVAAVTIFIVIYVSVVGKKRQIGILKAIGMRNRVIVASFVFHALFYAITGILAGLLITYLFLEPYFINYPLEFPIGWVSLLIKDSDVFFCIYSLMIAALIGGYIPASKGAKESILEAMWG